METKLLEHGKLCDHAKDKPLYDLMKSYNSRDNNHFRDDGTKDDLRRQFQQEVLNSATKACNHFKFFYCTSSGTCGCKDNLVFDTSTGYCTKPHPLPCWNTDYRMKVFEFKYQAGTFDTTIHYFVFQELDCVSGTSCETFTFEHSLCIKAEDTANIQNLQLEFDKKFSIPPGGNCSPDEHEELFKLGTSSRGTLEDFQKVLQGLVSKTSVQYCKIRQRATCSKAGKCTCVSPGIPDYGDCVVPLNEHCDGLRDSDRLQEHKDLDNLVPPHETNEYIQKIFCTYGTTCNYFPGACAVCKKYTTCEGSKTNQHVDHIDGNHLNLHPSMQTDEGRKLIWDLHRALYRVEDSMTLAFGKPCDNNVHSQLESSMHFLEKLRTDCGCEWKMIWHIDSLKWAWECQNRAVCVNGTDFEKPKWDTLLKSTQDLISKPMCKWNSGMRCVSGTCQCSDPEDSFYENEMCYADLVGKCRQVSYKTDVHSRLCRMDDLYCDSGICKLKSWSLKPDDPNLNGSDYIAALKERILTVLIPMRLVVTPLYLSVVLLVQLLYVHGPKYIRDPYLSPKLLNVGSSVIACWKALLNTEL